MDAMRCRSTAAAVDALSDALVCLKKTVAEEKTSVNFRNNVI